MLGKYHPRIGEGGWGWLGAIFLPSNLGRAYLTIEERLYALFLSRCDFVLSEDEGANASVLFKEVIVLDRQYNYYY